MIISKDSNNNWTPVATGNGTFVGTKAAFDAVKDDLPDNTVAYTTDDGVDEDVKIFRVSGRILNAASDTTTGYGTALITCHKGIAKIEFGVKITTAGSVSDKFDWGLNRDLLINLNSNIPTISPRQGGNCIFIKPDGTIDVGTGTGGSMGYAGSLNINGQFWCPGRIYNQNNNSSVGSWPSNNLAVDTILVGTCYGIYTI